ncbi:hypothetical protein [Parasediminibacterium sp. JCM 36343]|uniref:hypothetical protein n=1 Tax=Parasediminibacterium sp. JCM 36343 TaxID=3374279 RepID=UPI00397D6E61
MMKSYILLLSLFVLPIVNANAQMKAFDSLTSKVMFRIWEYESNDSIKVFLKRYVPFIAEPIKGKWKAYPPNYFVLPREKNIVHSLVFYTHPFIDVPFKEGQIDFLTRETDSGKVWVRDIHLWFKYADLSAAQKGFDVLCSMFAKVGKQNKLEKTGTSLTAVYENPSPTYFPNTVSFMLMKDELIKTGYKIFFRQGEIE